jgi:GntR family transcriptional repressor for pyruvate dehydrogenase complex
VDVSGPDLTALPSRKPHLAEMVADSLRERILSGAIPAGSVLAKQDSLLAEFGVSKPSLREAFRILETEGLITVQRGKVGGAVVHVPRPEAAAYTLAMVMQSRHVPVSDIGKALRYFEPQCAALCAERGDRATEVVPALRAVHEQALVAGLSPQEVLNQARRFHELIVELCGNDTMILVVGTLESLWSAHERDWERSEPHHEAFSNPEPKRSSRVAHGKMLTLIEAGDVDGVARLARKHLEESVFYSRTTAMTETVRAGALKAAVFPR